MKGSRGIRAGKWSGGGCEPGRRGEGWVGGEARGRIREIKDGKEWKGWKRNEKRRKESAKEEKSGEGGERGKRKKWTERER